MVDSCIWDIDNDGEPVPEPVSMDTLAAASDMRAELERLRDVVCEEDIESIDRILAKARGE